MRTSSDPATLPPYIGARPFRRNETIYGRARESRDLLSLLVGDRIVLLNSPSGAGKTSLIQAALIPRLEQRRFLVRPTIRVGVPAPLAGANRYVLSVMQSLEEARPANEQLPPSTLASLSLDAYLSQHTPATATNGQVLIFDQFEEVLTLDPSGEEERLQFFTQLGDALADPWRWALFAIREEYVAALLEQYAHLVPTRFSNSFRLNLLGVEAASEAIRGPAGSQGVEFEAGVAEALARDLAMIVVQDSSGQAVERVGLSVEPVQLQVVCYRLWERRFPAGAVAQQVISAADVAALGSIDNALEEYYASGVARAAAAGQVPERLVRAWVDTQLITRQGFRSQVLAGNESSFGLNDATVDALTNAYLVREERRRGVTWLELAHDRLIAPLRANNARWFAENLSPLQRQAEIWMAQGQPESLLFREAELATAETWASTHQDELTSQETLFLENCREEQRRLEERARTARRMRTLAIGASIAAGLAMVAFLVAFNFYTQANASYQRAEMARMTAESSSRMSRARELAAGAHTQIQSNPQRALLLALRAVNTTEPGDPDLPEIRQILQQTVQEARLRWVMETPDLVDVALSPDGESIVGTTFDGEVLRWPNDGSNLPLQRTATHTGSTNGIAFSPDGRFVATSGGDSAIRLWSFPEMTLLRTSMVYSPTLLAQIRFSPDGQLLSANSYDDSTIYLLKTADLSLATPPLVHPDLVNALDFSPDGRWLATAGNDGVARIWETSSGALVAELEQRRNLDGTSYPLYSIAFSPTQSNLLVTSGQDALIHVWDVASGREERTLFGHSNSILQLAFAPNGAFLASASSDTSIRIWDVAAGQELFSLHDHSGAVFRIAFTPDSAGLISAGYDRSIRRWDLPMVHGQAVYGVAYSPDGRMIVSTANGKDLKVWDATSQALLHTFTTDEYYLINPTFSPDGQSIAAAGASGSAYLWSLADMQAAPRTIMAHPGGCYAVAWSPDGNFVATSGVDTSVRVWAVADLAIQRELTAEAGQITSVSWSADGQFLAAASQNDLLIWNVTAGILIPKPDTFTNAKAVAWSPHGLRLAVVWQNQPPTVYNIEDETKVVLEQNPSGAERIHFSADGNRVVLPNTDGSVRVWESHTGQLVLAIMGSRSPNDARFSPDGNQVIIADAGGFVRLALLDANQLKERASQRAMRDFTVDECSTYAIDPCTWNPGLNLRSSSGRE
ncbi:WD-40 repeat-containing protein [Oscillochloris trichoides DG-6]|uniref:WD-40 repeat-containing protein n=1 Tax=Oscillochloris trichoides DG-6 TaxID=765420 RepID=E1IEV9_9CHLR|nr:PD40 domain-containing protein [Oscillochloris trichoides]EFO80256.1 WD-40 repeat-containing protein [Oscillochloris trichoides DG-6]